MLTFDVKRKINTLRDILVGKVPDPKAQVEQITIALIYKFMDDMDIEGLEFGGTRQFFTGEYEKYAWTEIMKPENSGQQRALLYAEGIEKMTTNPNLPQLFRDIFRGAYIPYRDPDTLNMFLKEVSDFSYDNSEDLGNAFEYLLSIMGSQGDAGQFRTPRHIIDFMVDIVEPKIGETILDPACGTAGFLISAYKYILRHNSSEGKNNGDLLTPDQRKQLAQNICGYDISPDMVRLSLVNMYLHRITEPRITEYDTLTSDAKWNEYFDVILANPPFMSPKGGIKPHTRFSIQSKRSEALFVDYIIEHLTKTGRGAVIVPEGVIFKTDSAFVKLRKMLINDNYLYGVISLPQGVFNPYSGVKTSILLLDKVIAKLTDKILFAKIENDGFSLGAQRRPIEGSQLKSIASAIKDFRTKIHRNEECASNAIITLVEKTKIKGTFNLCIENYINTIGHLSCHYRLVKLGDVCDIERGASPRPINDYITNDKNGINWIKISDALPGSMYITQTKEKIKPEGALKSRKVYIGDFILSNSMSFGRPYIMAIEGCIHDGWLVLRDKNNYFVKKYLYYILSSDNVYHQFENKAIGGVVNNLNSALVKEVIIPLPSINEQQAIVAELETIEEENNKLKQQIEKNKAAITARIAKIWNE